MLNSYIAAVQNLMQAPSAPVALVSTAQLTIYINTARAQVALDAECIRQFMTLALASGTQSYAFSLFSGADTGVQTAPLAVRQIILSGFEVARRDWEWFVSYRCVAPGSGTPSECAQQGQGQGGTLYFWPIPNAALTASVDVVGLPVPLASDSDPEAIPYPWTDAVPFYAAWLALMSQQRQADAELMLRRYEMLARRGRQGSTPTYLPNQAPGAGAAVLAAAHQTVTQLPPPTGRS